jgi:hypothetical protein
MCYSGSSPGRHAAIASLPPQRAAVVARAATPRGRAAPSGRPPPALRGKPAPAGPAPHATYNAAFRRGFSTEVLAQHTPTTSAPRAGGPRPAPPLRAFPARGCSACLSQSAPCRRPAQAARGCALARVRPCAGHRAGGPLAEISRSGSWPHTFCRHPLTSVSTARPLRPAPCAAPRSLPTRPLSPPAHLLPPFAPASFHPPPLTLRPRARCRPALSARAPPAAPLSPPTRLLPPPTARLFPAAPRDPLPAHPIADTRFLPRPGQSAPPPGKAPGSTRPHSTRPAK